MGQIRRGVDAQNFFRLCGEVRNGQSVSRRQADNVSQVLLALGVAPPDAGQRGKQKGSLQAVDAAVHLAYGSLARGGVALFDDAGDMALIVPHDAAVTRRIIQVCRQHRERRSLLPVLVEQVAQGRCAQQRYVTAQHQDITIEVSQHGFRLGDRVPGAQLRFLYHAARAEALAYTPNGIGLMTHHGNEALRRQGLNGRQHVRDEGAAGQWVQNLGEGRPHAGAFTGGKDDDCQSG